MPMNRAATIASRHNINAVSSERICAGTRIEAATASSASIAATRGIASTIRPSPSRVWTFTKGIASSRSVQSASHASYPGQLLVNASGREDFRDVRSRKGEERTVLVKALASEAALRYRAWVTKTGGSCTNEPANA